MCSVHALLSIPNLVDRPSDSDWDCLMATVQGQ